jgi:hypothetical protein
MQFRSDEQRKAIFAKLKKGKKGTGTKPKPPSKPSNPNPPFVIGGGQTPTPPPGTWTGTGGAIYETPDSNWFQAPPTAPNYGTNLNQLTSPGVGPYNPPTFQQFQPPTTLWGDLYLISQGVEPSTGNVQWGYGTPGTLKPPSPLQFGKGETWRINLFHSIGRDEDFFGKWNPVKGISKLPNTALSPKRNQPRPWWAK